jgi:L-malate glycosyltransferase
MPSIAELRSAGVTFETDEAVAIVQQLISTLRSHPAPRTPHLAPRTVMFSLHVDTARTWRGGQNQVLLTVNGLRSMGHRASLVAHPDGELRRRAAEGLDLVPIAPRTEMDLSAAWKFSRIVKRLQPDVVHAHDPHGVAMAALALSMGVAAAKGGPTPALVAARRVDFHLKGNSFSRWKYRQVDCFVAASEAIRQMLVADGVPAERTVTVHEGIDVEHVVAAPPVNVHEAFWLPHGSPVVGNVAALVPHKGQRYLIDAAHLVVQQVPDARFVILGEGELREHLEKQVHEHHLEKHVLLPGFRTDVLGCVKGFDLFVMSSVTEGLGTSLLDAMACARPIVATRAGGIPEIVEDGVNGLLAPVRDHHALAEAIVRALKDPGLRQRMGDAGFARVNERFTVERMVSETAEVYARVAGRPHVAGNERPPAAG